MHNGESHVGELEGKKKRVDIVDKTITSGSRIRETEMEGNLEASLGNW